MPPEGQGMRREETAHVAVATVAALAGLLAGCGDGQSADRAERPLLTAEQEIQIGRAAAPHLERLAGGRLENLAVEAYVRTIGQRVARSTPRRELPYRFAVLDTADVRAFALPGGLVYLTRGLLASLKTESQLAAALAHQLAHINARHVVRSLCGKCGKALLLDAVAAAQPTTAGSDARRRTETLARLAEVIHEHEYEADTEAAADRLGLDYLVAAGYNPSGMVAFLEVPARSAAPDVPAARITDSGSRAGRIRRIVEQKYRGCGGRVADEEYRGEVLDRLGGPIVPAR